MQYDYVVAVATVNGPERLESFILSVKEHTKDFNYIISICDDYSREDLSERNHNIAMKHGCLYQRNAARSGVPYSWNMACRAVDSKNIVVSNDDILVCHGWLNAYDAFRKANEHLSLGVLAWPATANVNDVSNKTTFEVSIDESHVIHPIVACAGYLFAFPRRLYNLVGGFDERYFATWEEIDFGAELCMMGFKSIGLNGPVIYHQGGASFSDPINNHPAKNKQSLAQQQWIDKWSNMLNINKSGKTDQQLIKEISESLTSRIPKYTRDDFVPIKIGQ